MAWATRTRKAGSFSLASSLGLEMKAVSTSTAGMAAPRSTTKGACFTPRWRMPTRWLSWAWMATASRSESCR